MVCLFFSQWKVKYGWKIKAEWEVYMLTIFTLATEYTSYLLKNIFLLVIHSESVVEINIV